MSRADARGRREVQEEYYSDFDMTFAKNPLTGQLARVTNDDAIKASMRNILLTQTGEWPRHPNLGARIYRQLFEEIDAIMADEIRSSILVAMKAETRVGIVRLDVIPMTQENGYRINIFYYTTTSPEVQLFTTFLRRLR
jgi:phage baseplate assembly protein W